jgi:nucleoid-associated protein
MPVSHAIVHHLHRAAEAKAGLRLAEGELPPGELTDNLLSKLKSGFLARLTREHGSFSPEGEEGALVRELKAYLENGRSLPDMSRALMKTADQMLDERDLALDAHFLFFEEKSFEHHSFYLFVAGHTESVAIGPDLTVQTSYAIDTGPSLFGIKVDLAEWTGPQNYAYLSLLPPRSNQPLAEMFRQFTGFSNGLNKAEATAAFLDGVEAFSSRLPEEQVAEYRNQVVDYCVARDREDAPVKLEELAQSLENVDSDEFIKVMASHSPAGDQDMLMDRRSLRRYVKFAGREKDLAISFASHQLNSRVHYDPESDTLRIYGVPKALRNQLVGHLKE